MKKITVCMIISFLLMSLAFTMSEGSADMKKITEKEIRKEFETLKDKLGNTDIYIEPCPEGSMHIFSYKGKKNIVKIVYNAQGDVLLKDTYTCFPEKLIWEHEEYGTDQVHFTITVDEKGNLTREDIQAQQPTAINSQTPTQTPASTFSPTFTPTPHMTPILIPSPTATQISTAQPLNFKERIIFSSNRDGNMHIYTMNLDGTNLHQVTKEKYSDIFPSISPDGRKVVYVSDESGKWNIYIINLDSTGKTRITDEGNEDILPLFIDDNSILFQSCEEKVPQIYRINLKDKSLTKITGAFTLAMHPAIYPDRKKIAFVGEKGASFDIYSIGVEGDDLKQLTHSGFVKSFPSVSPDGNKIAFAGNSDGYWKIYIVDPIMGIQKEIKTSFKESTFPSFTSDSKWLIFQALEGRWMELFKIDLSTNDTVKLTENGVDNIQPRCQFISTP